MTGIFQTLAVKGVQQLQPYQPGKPIEELQRELGLQRVVKLASNENPLGPSPLAMTAMEQQLKQVWLYPDGSGYQLRQALALKHGVEMGQITLGNGSSDPLEFVVRVFVHSGEEVLYSHHSFALYPLLAQMVGGIGIAAPATEFGHDLTALQANITPRTKVIFIANPNNPTGTWLHQRDLYAFLQQVPPTVVVVLDEAYFEYAHYLAPEIVVDTTPWLAEFPNLVITRTFSKVYGLAGVRVGYSLSSAEIADLINRVRPPFNVNSLALAAATAALTDEHHLERSVTLNRSGMEQLMDGLRQLGLTVIPSLGNFLCFDTGQPAQPIYQGLLQQGVIVRPVANYGLPNHLRVTIGLPQENQLFLERLEQVLRQHPIP